jgi:L-asparaginase II
MPLERMALAFANLPTLPQAQRITQAMRARPHLVGGADGTDVLLMQLPDPNDHAFVAKGGAEGLLCAVDLATSTGYALKTEDGDPRAHRAAAAAFMSLDLPPLQVKNTRGEIVGELSLRTSSA